MATDIVGSIVSKIAELLVEPAIRQFRYMFCFNNFVQEFDEQMMNLALAFYRLQDAVNVAERNAEDIEIDVNTWLENAKNEIEGVNCLQNEKGKIIKCFTWCPNSMRQFKLSKALAKKTETLRKLEENSRKFRKVSHKAPLQEIKFLPSKEFTLSGSSKEAFKQIMKALKDDKVNMIGLYGMGGVGKTTLVNEVRRRAKELQLFDEVLMATLSQNPNVTGIQDQMADRLGLKFKENSKEGRAGRLWQRLQGKKMLIVLDDVWKVIDFQEIGIPFGDDHRGCKILLTTRLEDMCSYMKCKEKVLLGLFSEEEAWALFKINADLRDEDSTLNTVAKKVARECNGLPVALVTVGRALRDKSVVEWEVASEELKNSQFRHLEQIDGQKNAYACLKLSYDYLTFDETKSCFLLCCLFPEDYNIPIEDLTRYAVGYGLHKDGESIENARKRVYVAIKNLKACCMLLGTESEEYVKMHDLVRDVAIRIASSEKYGFMVKAGIGLLEWPTSNKSFEGCTTISLMENELAELPEGLVCPQLKVLLLGLDRGLNVPERFFEGMKAIEVLSLQGGCLSLQSLQFSTNLQSLLLRWCECKDLIWLRKLQRLKILGFIACRSVEELPDEIGEFKELRLLDLTGCRFLRRIPVNLIGRLKKLEELLIGDFSFNGWDVVGCDSTEGMNASLTELSSLSHLAVLSLKIPKVECIPRDFVFPRLLKYDIVLGDGYSITEYPTSTRLFLGEISATSLNAKTFEQLFPTVSQISFRRVEGLKNIVLSSDQMTTHGHGSQKDFLQRLEHVQVGECGDIRTLFPAKWQQALKKLRSVEIYDCESLEEVFELGEADEGINEEKELSFLTELQLSSLPELNCIWKGPTRHVSLHSLTRLNLQDLDKLTFIFPPSLAQSLIHLETLQIKYCGGLKRLIREEDGEREIIPECLGFPKLKTLSISRCDELEYVFPVSVSPSLQNLEEMEIREANNLKQVFYSGEGDDIIVKSKIKDGIINFPQLRKLYLFSVSSCSFFGPKDFAAQLPSLQELTIEGHEEGGNLLAQLRVRPLYFSIFFFFSN
ncbi:probable disease resistance protein At4g27220 [Populus nigra]|uniref:probable disease resistance protein At4g27220 n=1 Tax=Populus nigra TaxID=3691 RepID=UPI002B27C0A9|nr:probable disease resistance protein At4g27220 [Populus nigra]